MSLAPEREKRNMKKMMALLMSAVLVLAMAGCGEKKPAEKEGSSGEVGGNVQIPNPISEEENLEKAAEKLGFSITLPEGFEEKEVRTIGGELLDVTAVKDGVSINLRKAKGSEDVSGDYNQYAEEKQIILSEGDSVVTDNAAGENLTENERLVLLKGADGKMSLAVWTQGEFAYSVRCDGEGVDWEELCELVQQIG